MRPNVEERSIRAGSRRRSMDKHVCMLQNAKWSKGSSITNPSAKPSAARPQHAQVGRRAEILVRFAGDVGDVG